MGIIFTLVLLIAVAISVVWSVFVRKLVKTRIKSISRIACVVLAFVGTVIAKSIVSGPNFANGTLLPFLSRYLPEAAMGMVKESALLLEVAVGLPVAFVAPLIFVILYIILSILAGIVCLFVTPVVVAKSKGGSKKVSKKKKRKKNSDGEEEYEFEEDYIEEYDDESSENDGKGNHVPYAKARAIAWSLASALIVLIVVLLPVSFYSGILADVADVAAQTDIMSAKAQETVDKVSQNIVEPLSTSVPVQMFRIFGGDAMIDGVTSFTFKGETLYLNDEIDAVVDVLGDAMPLTKTKLQDYGTEEADSLVSIANSLSKSKFLTAVGSEAVYLFTDGVVNGDKSLGVSDDDMFGGLINKTVTILHDDAKNTTKFTADVKTVAEMASAMIKGGVLANMDDTDALFEGLAGGDAITNVIIALGKNASMKCLIPEVTNIGIKAIASFVEVKEDADEAYNDLMNTIAADLNSVKDLDDATKVSELSPKLNDAFDHAGIAIDKKVIDLYSVAMIEGILNKKNDAVTANDVQNFFVAYANANDASAPAVLANMIGKLSALDNKSETFGDQVAAILKNGGAQMLGINEGALYEAVVNVQLKKAIAADTSANTAALQSSEAFEKVTLLVFLDELVIDVDEATGKINDSTLNNEAKAIGGIFSKAGSLLNDVSGDELNIGTMAESVGGVLNSLQESVCVGENRTPKLFIAIVQSGMVRDAANMDIATATELGTKGSTSSNGEKVDYAKTFKTISNAMDVLQNMNSSTEEGMSTEALSTVLKDLNPQTAGMMETYITEDRLTEDYGLNAEQSTTAAPLISDVFGYWNDPNVNMTEEESAKEAEALSDVMNLVTSASDKANSGESSQTVFGGEDSVLGKSADDTVATFMASEALKHSLSKNNENGTLEEDPFGMNDMMVNDEENAETEDLKDAMKDYYDASEDKEKDRADLINLGKLFGFSNTEMEEILGE